VSCESGKYSGFRSLAPAGPDRAERRFTLLFAPVAFGFGARMALVAFDGPLVRRFTESGYLIGLVLAIGPLVATVATPWFGRVSDRWRRRSTYYHAELVRLLRFLVPTGSAVLDAWRDGGKAPEQVAASRVRDGKVDRTRPLCAWPKYAVYTGSGSVDEAASFVCK